MITTADLKTQTRRDLAGTAREIGIAGWHSMKKDELIEAIRTAQSNSRAGASRSSAEPTSDPASKKTSAAKAKASGKETQSSGVSAKSVDKTEESSTVKRRRPVATKQPAKKPSKATANLKNASSPKEEKASRKEEKPKSKTEAAKVAVGTGSKATSSKVAAKTTAKGDDVSSAKEAPVSAGETNTAVKSSGRRPKRPAPPPRKPTSPEILKVLRKQQASAESRKDLSACVVVNGSASGNPDKPSPKERIVLIVRDSYWLQASWVITRSSVERARAAMGADWHTAEPVLRLLEVAHGASANTAEQVVRDIPIHGGVNNWYIDVENPPSRYRVVIGYRSGSNRFHTLFRSNIVLTPEPGACDPIDGHWQDIAEDYERIYSLSDNDSGTGSNDLREMFEERLQRPMIDFNSDTTGLDPDLSFRREKELPFEVDAELIVYGSTSPGASVTLAGAPVRLRPDGTFTVRMELPDRRQVLPVVACSRDGLRQRTTVVAVERNTKVMEPVSKNHMD